MKITIAYYDDELKAVNNLVSLLRLTYKPKEKHNRKEDVNHIYLEINSRKRSNTRR